MLALSRKGGDKQRRRSDRAMTRLTSGGHDFDQNFILLWDRNETSRPGEWLSDLGDNQCVLSGHDAGADHIQMNFLVKAIGI